MPEDYCTFHMHNTRNLHTSEDIQGSRSCNGSGITSPPECPVLNFVCELCRLLHRACETHRYQWNFAHTSSTYSCTRLAASTCHGTILSPNMLSMDQLHTIRLYARPCPTSLLVPTTTGSAPESTRPREQRVRHLCVTEIFFF